MELYTDNIWQTVRYSNMLYQVRIRKNGRENEMGKVVSECDITTNIISSVLLRNHHHLAEWTKTHHGKEEWERQYASSQTAW